MPRANAAQDGKTLSFPRHSRYQAHMQALKQTMGFRCLSLALFAAIGCTTPTTEQPSTMNGLRNQRQPWPGIFTGGQPTKQNLQQAQASGIRTVINLRMPQEKGMPEDEQATIEQLGMRYVSIPVDVSTGLTEDNAQKLADTLKAAGATPVIVHCGSGNRVGALFALKAFHVDGASAEESLEVGRKAGLTKLEPRVRSLLGLQP